MADSDFPKNRATGKCETKFFRQVLSDETGASALEYGMITALVGIVLIAVLSAIGVSLADFLGGVSDVVADAEEIRGLTTK